jgi:hypothetical protein
MFLTDLGAAQQGAPREAQCAKVSVFAVLVKTSTDMNSIPVRKDVCLREPISRCDID